jgi:hypothetical protein
LPRDWRNPTEPADRPGQGRHRAISHALGVNQRNRLANRLLPTTAGKNAAAETWTDAFGKQLDEEQRAFEKQQTHHYSKVYFNGPIETLEVSLLDFSGATVTRKDLNLPVRRFDRHTTEKTIQPLSFPVVVYDDQASTWLKAR